MSVNVNSVTESYDAWYDYKYCGNSRGITAEDIAQIETKWESKLSGWRAQASKDENKYEIDDSGYEEQKQTGRQNAKEQTGFSGESDRAKAKSAHIIASVSEGVAYAGAGISAICTLTQRGYDNRASFAGAVILAGVGGALVGVTAGMKSDDTNGEATRALDEYNNILPDAQAELASAGAAINNASTRAADIAEDLNDDTEAANREIEKTESEMETKRRSVQELKDKAKNGIELTDSEKEYLRATAPLLEAMGEHIAEISNATSENTVSAYEEMVGYQEDYQEAAETSANVKGMTDFVSEFDEETIEGTQYAQKAAQTATSAGGTVMMGGAATVASGITKLNNPVTAGVGIVMMSLGGVAIGEGVTAKQMGADVQESQQAYNMIAQTSFETRVATQEFNSSVYSSYEDQIALYDDHISIVENLETEIPDDLSVPEIDSSLFAEKQDTAHNAPADEQPLVSDSESDDDKKTKV